MPTRVIVRLPNWLGDTVMAVPALRALRTGWPEARILVAGPWAEVMAGQELADVLVSYPRAWRGRLATADAVRAFAGEIVILLPHSFEAALVARYWGARRRIGFAVGGRSLLLTDRVPWPVAGLHQIDEYLGLVAHLGLAVESRVPSLAPLPAEHEMRVRARRLLDDATARRHAPRVGDGLIRLDADGIVQYASPNALSAYHRMGLASDLVGQHLGKTTAELAPTRGPVDEALSKVASETVAGHIARWSIQRVPWTRVPSIGGMNMGGDQHTALVPLE